LSVYRSLIVCVVLLYHKVVVPSIYLHVPLRKTYMLIKFVYRLFTTTFVLESILTAFLIFTNQCIDLLIRDTILSDCFLIIQTISDGILCNFNAFFKRGFTSFIHRR